jgi:hypothetical protein
MVRRELIFFGTLIGWLLFTLIGVFEFPIFLKMFGYLDNLLVILILIGVIIPRYFSKKYNTWLETDPFRKK